jgi:hypothetical protein
MILLILSHTVITGLWVAAWLSWVFDGHVRQFLWSKVFPASWRPGLAPWEVATMTADDLRGFLSLQSGAPRLLNKLFTCPVCLSAHLAVTGVGLCFVSQWREISQTHEIVYATAAAVLVWAGGSFIGQRLYFAGRPR